MCWYLYCTTRSARNYRLQSNHSTTSRSICMFDAATHNLTSTLVKQSYSCHLRQPSHQQLRLQFLSNHGHIHAKYSERPASELLFVSASGHCQLRRRMSGNYEARAFGIYCHRCTVGRFRWKFHSKCRPFASTNCSAPANTNATASTSSQRKCINN